MYSSNLVYCNSKIYERTTSIAAILYIATVRIYDRSISITAVLYIGTVRNYERSKSIAAVLYIGTVRIYERTLYVLDSNCPVLEKKCVARLPLCPAAYEYTYTLVILEL